MFIQLALSTLMVVLTIIIHGAGIYGIERMLRVEQAVERHGHIHPLSARGVAFTLSMVLALITLHGVEIWTYAALYWALGALPDFNTALYISTITYSTTGFSDALIPAQWRILIAIEGINGVILLGWSTAVFVSFLGRFRRV